VCVDSLHVAPAARCALILRGDELLRGAPATTVSMGQPLWPIPLSHFVRGDSALKYAFIYERQSRMERMLKFAGEGTMFFTTMASWAGGPKPRTADGKTNVRVAVLIGSGAALMAASVPFRWMAEKNADLAVRAYNRTLVGQ
jgi:hypothetical protein